MITFTTMETIALASTGVLGVALVTVGSAITAGVKLRAFRVGGLRFLRVGRIQLSFCIVRKGK